MNTLNDLLRRAQSWPDHARKALEEVALEIEAELQKKRTYVPTQEERDAIRRGVSELDQGRYVTQEEIDKVFAKYRNK